MHKYIQRIAVFLFLLAIIPFGIARANVGDAVTYLESQTESEWITMAFAAADHSTDVSYLTTYSGSSATDGAKAILALTAAGQDPETYSSTDLIAELRSFHTGGQIGSPTQLNDDIFAILAFVSAGIDNSDQAIVDAKNTLIASQNGDGGWGWSTTATSDVDDTAVAIMALLEAGVSSSDSVITNAKAYLQSAQNDDGGFPYDPQSAFSTASNSGSTAWTISAIYALGENPTSWTQSGGNPLSFLETLQDAGGWYHYDSPSDSANSFTGVTTAYAVVAESGKSYPVARLSGGTTEPQIAVSFRIEGSSETICEGDILAYDAMDVVINASSVCDFSYNITDTAYGPYLDTIGSDVAEGLAGWQYMVDYTPPAVGAADYVLETDDNVLWYFAEWGVDDTVTRLTLSDEEIDSGATLTVTIEQLIEGSWSALEGATVYVGSSTGTTNASGQATFTPADGAHVVYAEKDTHVRTEKETVIVGDSANSSVALKANVVSGGGDDGDNDPTEDVIAFSLDTSTLNFGDIKPGSNSAKNLKITNTGTVNIHIEGKVTGDSLFRSYLNLAGSLWRSFVSDLTVDASQDISVSLPIPGNYSNFGSKDGTLTFWATKN